jgi:hypothetical protein
MIEYAGTEGFSVRGTIRYMWGILSSNLHVYALIVALVSIVALAVIH